MTAAARSPYQYVVLRCVPRVDREEFLNVGVVLFCEALDHLDAAWHVEPSRLRALAPQLDLDRLCEGLVFVEQVCAGDVVAAGAPAAGPVGRRFGFLRAPRSTIVQPGPVHGGLTHDPGAELQRLLAHLVTTP